MPGFAMEDPDNRHTNTVFLDFPINFYTHHQTDFE